MKFIHYFFSFNSCYSWNFNPFNQDHSFIIYVWGYNLNKNCYFLILDSLVKFFKAKFRFPQYFMDTFIFFLYSDWVNLFCQNVKEWFFVYYFDLECCIIFLNYFIFIKIYWDLLNWLLFFSYLNLVNHHHQKIKF